MNNFILSALMVLGLATALHAQDGNAAQQQMNYGNHESLLRLNDDGAIKGKKSAVRYSVLTGYMEGTEPIRGPYQSNFKAQIDTALGTHRIYMYNLSILEMFTHGLRPAGTVILEVKDPSKFRYLPEYGNEQDWLRKNGYCYELMMPVGVIKGIKIVNEELERFFNVKCFAEKRMMKAAANEEAKEMEVLVIRENGYKI